MTEQWWDTNVAVNIKAKEKMLACNVWINRTGQDHGAERVPVKGIINSFVGIDTKTIFAGYTVILETDEEVMLYSDNKVHDIDDYFVGTWSYGD